MITDIRSMLGAGQPPFSQQLPSSSASSALQHPPSLPTQELTDQPGDDAVERARKAALRAEAKEIKAEVERRLGSTPPPQHQGRADPEPEPEVPARAGPSAGALNKALSFRSERQQTPQELAQQRVRCAASSHHSPFHPSFPQYDDYPI